jgi:hypothetical protein
MDLRIAIYLIIALLPKHNNTWSSPLDCPMSRAAESSRPHPVGEHRHESQIDITCPDIGLFDTFLEKDGETRITFG